MDLRQYIDTTYLKTTEESGLSQQENIKVVQDLIDEAIAESFKAVMIRPDMVSLAKNMMSTSGALVKVGTVIDFPEGTGTLEDKLKEAQQAINDGADELDFVINYTAFKQGDVTKVKAEVLACTELCLQNNKVTKWIIEVAALTEQEIVRLTTLIKNVVLSNFDEKNYSDVFVKSSTGFYKTDDGRPNGAAVYAVKLMLENSFPLPVKAAGGIRSYDDALQMVALGVKRLGTSSAKKIIDGEVSSGDY